MSSDIDSDLEDLFQILTAHTAATEDKVLEFSQGLEKNMLIRSSFFALCHSVATLVCQQTKWQCHWDFEKFIFIEGAGTCLVSPAMTTSTL